MSVSVDVGSLLYIPRGSQMCAVVYVAGIYSVKQVKDVICSTAYLCTTLYALEVYVSRPCISVLVGYTASAAMHMHHNAGSYTQEQLLYSTNGVSACNLLNFLELEYCKGWSRTNCLRTAQRGASRCIPRKDLQAIKDIRSECSLSGTSKRNTATKTAAFDS